MTKKSIILLLSFIFVQIAAEGRKTMQMNGEGKFKIVQFTDTHYDPKADTKREVIALIKATLQAEKPDLVVLTGDIVTGEPALDYWDELIGAIEDEKIQWAAVFGNHDDEKNSSRSEIMTHLMKKKYCMAEPGPEKVFGTGNYVLELREGDSLRFVLYCMDSNAYPRLKGVGGYGWFDFSQIEWYRATSREYRQANGGNPLTALAFFHIPLNEYTEMTVARKKMLGMKNENECTGGINTGMFAAMLECGDVIGTFVGHDHDNDYIGDHCGIALAYGRFSGSNKTTYTHMTPGARVIELRSGKRGFQTWIRLKDNSVINSTTIGE